MKRIIFVLIFAGLSPMLLRAHIVWDGKNGWIPTAAYEEKFDNEPYEALQLMNEGKCAQIEGQSGMALSKYKEVCKNFPNSVFAPEAYFQIGEIRTEKSQFMSAFKAFSTILQKYPEYPKFNAVLEREFEIASMLKDGQRPKYFGIIPGFRDYTATINFYKKIIKEAPFSEMAPIALMNIGEIASNKNKTLEAISAFEQLIDDYPHSEYTPGAYFSLGKIYAEMIKSPLYDQGATRSALNYYEDFLTLYPNHELAEKAKIERDAMKIRLAQSKLYTGDFYFNARNNRKAAVIMYRRAQKSFPDSDVFSNAKSRIEHIKAGNLPKKTPVDFLFGRYKRPADEILDIELSTAEDGQEKFDFEGDFISFGSGDSSDKKFVNPDARKPEKSFVEVGPKIDF